MTEFFQCAKCGKSYDPGDFHDCATTLHERQIAHLQSRIEILRDGLRYLHMYLDVPSASRMLRDDSELATKEPR